MTKTTPDDKHHPRNKNFSYKPLALAISAILLGTVHNASHADRGLIDLGTFAPDNTGNSPANGVNDSGSVVVGEAFDGTRYRAFRWSEDTGRMISLGTLPGGESKSSGASAVNSAGDVVIGYSYNGTRDRAFRWTESSGTMADLGTFKDRGADYSYYAKSVNAAGDVVIGWARDWNADTSVFNSNIADYAFRWTPSTGMTDLGTFAGGKAGRTYAYGVNAAGDVVVGKADNGTEGHAFRWTEATGMVDLGTLAADKQSGSSSANGVNAEGNVVVGHAYNGAAYARAFRWTAATGMTDLGTFAGGGKDVQSIAHAVSDSGEVVVGYSKIGNANRAFRWTLNAGSATEGTMQTIEDWLKSNGVKVSRDASETRRALGINAAGDVVVGELANGHAFIANTKGLVDQVDNRLSLQGSSGVPARAMQDADMVMHGAHGSPLRGLLSAGKQSFWTAGDWGHYDNQRHDGNLGLAEIGYARGISHQTMVKFALGRIYNKQDTIYGGSTKLNSTYLMPEVIAKVAETPVYASFSAYYNWGDVDILRGYENAGTREFGRGNTDASTMALRARLDWRDAFHAKNTAFTPYTSVTYTRTKLDAYTETGGGFPARWNSRNEHATEARLGLDAVHPVNEKLDVLGRLEGVHRFNDTGAAASGDIAGLYGFTLPGQSYKRNWLRAAIGIEGKVGAGIATMTLNRTTQSNAADYWISASYRVHF